MTNKCKEALNTLIQATNRQYRWLDVNDKFNFACNNSLSCFATCCYDINIFLTPYDVLRMKKATNTTSEEFLARYTILQAGRQGLPLVMLNMNNEDKKCPFVNILGCKIYENRPWSCRMYPLALASANTGEEFYFIIENEPSCLGFKQEKTWTIKTWIKSQNIELYDNKNKTFKEITLHPYFQNGNKKLSYQQAKMFYMACYDLDRFKKFLFETKFFDIYDVESEVIEKMKEDEEELLNFGFRWLKFSLFWENTLKLKDKNMNKLLQVKLSR